jgi:hypothetical protein
MKVNDKELPKEILEYFKESINEMSDKDLIEMSKSIPDVIRGFRPNHADPKVIRKRIAPILANSEMPVPILKLLQVSTIQRKFIAVLSEEAFSVGLLAFSNYFGKTKFIGSAILDEREIIRENAWSFYNESKTTSIDKAAANKLIISEFKPFINLIKEISDKESTTDIKKNAANQLEKIRPLTPEEINGLIEKSPQFRKIRSDKNAIEKSTSEEIKKLNAENLRLQNENRQLSVAKNELMQLQQKIDTQVNERVEDIFKRRIGPWFASSESLLEHSSNGSKSLAKEAEEVLKKQAQRDLRYGRITIVNNELEELQKLKLQIEEAKKDSLQPMAELITIEQSLTNKISELKTLLSIVKNSAHELKESVIAFERKIKKISKIEDINTHRVEIETKKLHDSWTYEETMHVFESLSQQALSIYMQNHRSLAQKEIDLLNAYSPLNAIRIAMARGNEFYLLIDGHNVLHQLKPAWGIHFDKNSPGEKVRNHFINKLIDLTKHHPKITIDVWFDSPQATSETVTPRLRVKFSGGSGHDRADKKIEEDLNYLKAQSKQHYCYVVSADRDVINTSIRLKANTMSPLELFSIL